MLFRDRFQKLDPNFSGLNNFTPPAQGRGRIKHSDFNKSEYQRDSCSILASQNVSRDS